MTAGDSKAATTITQPALVSSPQSRPAPTRRALPSKPVAQRGQNWTPIRGQICKPIDTGQPVRRLEDQRLLTGKGQFIDDRPEDGALWLHVLRSPHAHAKIVSIDIQATRKIPGVEEVYSGADMADAEA